MIDNERDLIVRTFVDECAEHLAALEQALVALERAPGGKIAVVEWPAALAPRE